MTDRKDIEITKSAERFDSGERMSVDMVNVGQWYWVKETVRWDDEVKGRKKGDTYEWFGCVVEVGSNFAEIHSPPNKNGYSTTRVHFDVFEESVRYEPDPDSVFAEKIGYYKNRVSTLLGEVNELTARLGVASTTKITDKLQEGTNALVAVTSQPDVSAYKTALITAKEDTLPDLFKEIEKANAKLASWMIAPTMSLQASIGPMKKSIKTVEDRIYTLELYAGLSEEAVEVRKGAPASREEKLRIMQRRLYMDEECLVAYEAGGMDITNITDFDEWLARPANYERLLPFERCAAAFRVRRTEKERETHSLIQAFVNVGLRDADKTTFLYVRNGEQLWRIDCDFDFGERIVPDVTEFDPGQPMMMKMFGSRVDRIIPLGQWEVMRDEGKREQKRVDEERAKLPPEDRWQVSSYVNSDWKEYKPFDASNVYFDEALDEIGKRIKKYNRVAVIIQGLYDRSPVLHPHDPVNVSQPESFAASIDVIYDATSLTHGDKPDFEAYRKRLNIMMTTLSVVTGQQDYWMRVEAERENEKSRRHARSGSRPLQYTRFQPHGNPGPGLINTMAELKQRAGKAVFRWTREGRWTYDGRGQHAATITVPVSELLNVSAYKPGDFKQFFNDPRTRREYLKWAPLLLAAEDYHAGKSRKGNTLPNTWE